MKKAVQENKPDIKKIREEFAREFYQGSSETADESKKHGQGSLLSRLFPTRGFNQDKESLMENLSMMLDAGIGVLAAVESVKREVSSLKMKQILEGIEEDVHRGSYFWKSFKRSKIMPRYVISLMQIGEESGKLPDNLKLIAVQQQKNSIFRSKIRSAILYPVIIFIVTFLVGIGVSWFTLPRLAQVFSTLRLDLPAITRIMIQVGTFLGDYGIYIFPSLIIAGALGFFAVVRISIFKRIGISILLRIPGLRDLIQSIELARFGYVMGSLLNAGLSITKAIESLIDIASFEQYKKFFQYLKGSVERGSSFEASFAHYKRIDKIVPPSIQQMIIASERSGKLPETFLKIGERYEEKIDLTTKNLIVILEPLLLVIVWGFIVLVAFSVILPIYSLIGGLSDV